MVGLLGGSGSECGESETGGAEVGVRDSGGRVLTVVSRVSPSPGSSVGGGASPDTCSGALAWLRSSLDSAFKMIAAALRNSDWSLQNSSLSTELVGIRWNAMEFDGFRWNSMQFDGLRRHSRNLDCVQCDSSDFDGNQRGATVLNEIRRNSAAFDGSRSNAMDLEGILT